MKRKVLIVTMFFILLLSLTHVNAQASNNTIMEDTLSSSQSEDILGNGLNFNDGGGSLSDLQDVVKDGGIIGLTNNYTYNAGDPTDGIFVNENAMIFGNNITIDGKNQARLFVFNSSQIYISGINFVNFKTNLNGAAIYSNGSSAVITNCTFENCQAKDGGALYYDGISLLIVNSTFKSNEANDGGDAYVMASSTIIADSTFTSSNSKNGGGVYWRKTEKTFSLSDNSDSFLGDFIAFEISSIVGEIKSMSFGSSSIAIGAGARASGSSSVAIGNQAWASGSGSVAMGTRAEASGSGSVAVGYETLASGSGSVAVGHGVIAKSNNSVVIGYGNTFNNVYGNNGFYGSSVALGTRAEASGSGSVAIGNQALASGSGSVAIGAGALASGSGSVAMGTRAQSFDSGSVAVGNVSRASGSGSVAVGYEATADGINSYALGNGAFVDGNKSICWDGDVLKLNENLFTINIDGFSNSNAYLNGKYSILKGQNSKVVNAIASTILGNNYDLSNAYGITAYNGLIANDGLIIVNSTFTSNKAVNGGGSVYVESNSKLLVVNSTFENSTAGEGAAIYGINLRKVDVDNSSFMSNTANSGGAVFLKNSSNVQFVDSEFINNTASNSGGAINAAGSNISVISSGFYKNSANSGGAIYVVDSSVFTVRNSTFEDNNARNNVGGAIALSGEANIYYSNFSRNTALVRGGAIHSSDKTKKATRVYNSNFDANGVTGNKGNYYGGAIFYADLIENCNFTNNFGHSGGAVYQWNNHGYRLRVKNSTFINNTATYNAGAVYAHYGGDFTDCKFYDNKAGNVGGGIGGWNQIAQDCLFVNNRAKSGGAVGGESARSYYSTYINNSATNLGGSIYGDNLIINHNVIINSTSDNNGGAIGTIEYLPSDRHSSTFRNNTIINSTAVNKGGAVYLYDQTTVYKTTFDSNRIINAEAKNGGGLYSDSISLTLTNNHFENVDADIGGAIYNNRVMKLSNNTLVNSNADLGNDIYNAKNISVSYLTFIDNSTKYGSYLNNITIFATITDDMGNTITGQNVTFEINGKKYYAESIEGYASFNYTIDFASGSRIVNGSYAGSSLSNTVIKTGLIVTNLAKLNIDKSVEVKRYYVGDIAKYTIKLSNAENFTAYNVVVKDFLASGLEFIDGKVSKGSYANGLWTIDELYANEVVEFVYYCNLTKDGLINNTAYVTSVNSESNQSSASVNVLQHNPDIYVAKKSLDNVVIIGSQARFEIIVKNTGNTDLTNVVIVEDSFDGLEYANYIESSLWSHSVVNGNHVWTLNEALTPDGVVSLFVNFNTPNVGAFVNNAYVKSSQTDEELVNALVKVIKPEIKVEKICLTPSVVLGNQARFEIIVNNTGSVDLSDVTVCEDSFDGLVFDSYEASNLWSYSNVNNIPSWRFNEVLPAGEWISLIAVFNTTANGTFTNYVSVDSNMSQGNAKSYVNVLKPEMTVEKVTLTPNVILGDIAKYEIVIHNNGPTDLTNLVVQELPDESLIYDHYQDSGLFSHSVVNGVHTWTLDKLSSGAYAGFIIYYKTDNVGTVVNTINVKSTEIEEFSISNTTNVLLPSFTVEKIALKPYVLTNNQTIFEIVIRNTGEVPLKDVFIIEENYDGLIYDSAIGDEIWAHEMVGGKHKWTLNEELQSKEFIGLFLRFNTTEVIGNITNSIIAGSSETANKTANATVEVFKENVPEPPVSNSTGEVSYELFKSLITQEIIIGSQVTFQVVIHNNGDTNLENVILTELPPEGLIYDSFTDYLDLWTYDGVLSWSANDVIYPGEYVGFFITFNATAEGKFTNAIEAIVNDTDVNYANVSFEVLKPDFTIEKVLVENNIVNGSQATFEIVIHNTGKTSLNNLTVREYSFEGLVYDSFIDYLDLWTYNGDLSWTMESSLLPGEYVAFFVVFNTTDVGNFTNVVVANSSECADKYSNAVLSVLNQDFDISMICLNPITVLGNQVTFEITVQNTGKLDLSSLRLSDISFDGLIFDHYNDYLGHWIYNGDLTWNLAKTLVPREITSLFVVFNTTDVGNYTNVALAEILEIYSNEILTSEGDVSSTAKFANASVEVIQPEYVIEKVAINKTVNVGEQAIFEIVVKNTGKVNIDGIVISENPDEGLIFDHFIDSMNLWINEGMTWILNTTLLSDEVVTFYAVFNTTKAGNFTNVIASDNLTANAVVEVKEVIKPTNPSINISAIAESPIYLGNTSIIKITVENTGDVDLNDVFVNLELNDGLTIDSADLNNWTYENSKFSLNGVLKVSESSAFYVVVNTLKTGNLSNVAYAGFDNAQKDNSAFVIEVLDIPEPEPVPVPEDENGTDPSVDPVPVPEDENGTDPGVDPVPVPDDGNNTLPEHGVNNETSSETISDTPASKVNSKSVGSDNKTGNPLVLILLSLLALVSVKIRRKN